MFQAPAPAENHVEFQRITQIRTFLLTYIMFQTPAPAENPQQFQRIMQISCNSPTKSANYA